MARVMRSPREAPAWRIGKRVLGYSVLLTVAFLYVMPFILAIATSFKTAADATAHPLSIMPNPVSTEAYDKLSGGGADVPQWALNSLIVTVFVTLGRLLFDSMAGYALARLDFPGRKAVLAIIISTLFVPGIVLAIPRFLVLKQLNLLNSYAGLIIPLAFDAFGIFLMRQFFLKIPREMEESAYVDGATIFQTFRRVILPIAAPGLLTLTILSFQGSWNEFLHPLIAVPSNSDLYTLPVGLALLRGTFGKALDFPLLMAGSLLATIPVAIVFVVFQRYFVQGVAASGVKG